MRAQPAGIHLLLFRMHRDFMRTTLNIDDELLGKAQEFAGIAEKSAVVHEALRALIQREAARRLAERGGSDPKATAGPRRRSALPRKR